MGEAHVNFLYPGYTSESLLDRADAEGAGHTADLVLNLFHGFLIAK
jgi:hypothetical protein